MQPRLRLALKIGLVFVALYLIAGLVVLTNRQWVIDHLPIDLPNLTIGNGVYSVGYDFGPYYSWYQPLEGPDITGAYIPADLGVAGILLAGTGAWRYLTRRKAKPPRKVVT